MTIDEAIKHCLEVAARNEIEAKSMGCHFVGSQKAEVQNVRFECAADHRQLAEWLMELKDLRAEQNDQYTFINELMDELKQSKRLLKAAVEDIRHCMHSYDPCEVRSLLDKDGECPATDDDDCKEKYKWRYEDEAKKLIEGSEEVIQNNNHFEIV